MSGDDAMQGWVLPIGLIFPTALISYSLQYMKDKPGVEEMLSKAATYLRYQIGRGATWNHFTELHPLRRICPQDVDDTVCVSSFLLTRYPDFTREANSQLIYDNMNKDGLLYTWFTTRLRFNRNLLYWRIALTELKNPLKTFLFWRQTEATRHDIDAVVNANALLYLGDNQKTQNIIQYLIKIILDKKEDDCDTWYRNPYTVYYFFTRPYHAGITKLEPIKQPIIERIVASAQPDGRLGGCLLDTALGACALLNLQYDGPALQNAIDYIISKQGPTGGWERWLLYYGGPKKRAGYGCEEVTTGFCLEALQRFVTR